MIRSTYETKLARRNWEQGQREELARHVDRTFRCRECGLVWKQPVVHVCWRGNTITCPDCEDDDE